MYCHKLSPNQRTPKLGADYAKRFKSNKMVNHATSESEAILHISEQFVGFEIPDKSTVDHLFHGFTDATIGR